MPMQPDMCVPCGDGFINLRVGAIIMKDDKILMAGNGWASYAYTVGGRLKFGETAREAVIREVREETGRELEIDRLGFIHECYFPGDSPSKKGKIFYEIGFYFYMKVPEDYEPVSMRFQEGEQEERLNWVPIDGEVKYYPEFFRRELKQPSETVKHFVTDERINHESD